jgi:chemotaxis protein methyltransferase CheR
MSPEGPHDADAERLLEAIRSRHGFDLRGYSAPSLRRRLYALLQRSGLQDLEALRQRLLADPEAFTDLLDDLTVRVSDMFRDPPFYAVLREQVLPALRTYPFIRIWLSGCASGEEVYSTAIMLAEAGLTERAQIFATDLNPSALEQARQGVYAAERAASFAESYRRAGGRADFSSYYNQAYGGIAMKAALRRNVFFFQHDLVGDHVFGEMNLVCCRNVLIYFGRELRERVMGKLVDSLCPGGFLGLGSSERVLPGAAAARLKVFAPDERIYRYQG